MKAATIAGYGPPGVLAVRVVPVPRPRSEEVLLHVRAAAINPKDTFIRKGRVQRFTGSVFPLERIRGARVQQETKHTRGKIAIHLE